MKNLFLILGFLLLSLVPGHNILAATVSSVTKALATGQQATSAGGQGGGGPVTLEKAIMNLNVKDPKDPKREKDTITINEFPEHMVGVGLDMTGDAQDTATFIQKIGKGLVSILAGVAVLFVVLSAFDLLMATGSSDKITKAKKALTWIMLGILTIIAAYVIVKTVISTPFLGS